MQRIGIKVTIFFIFLITCSAQSMAGQSYNFKFPKKISYKIIRNKQYIVTSSLNFSLMGGLQYVLTMGNLKGFGISSSETVRSILRSNDLSLISSYVMKGKKLKEELRFKVAENIGLLGNQVYIHKSFENNSSPTITEIGSPYTVIDLLSSFVVLSNKVYNKNFSNEQFNLFIKTSYIVESSVKKNVLRQYLDDQVSTSQVTLKYFFPKGKKKNQPESVDLFVFYIYNDKSKGICFPICVEFEDVKGNKCQMIAAKAIP